MSTKRIHIESGNAAAGVVLIPAGISFMITKMHIFVSGATNITFRDLGEEEEMETVLGPYPLTIGAPLVLSESAEGHIAGGNGLKIVGSAAEVITGSISYIARPNP